MSDQNEQQTGKVPLTSFLADFRSDLTDKELRDKYQLPARAFVSLIKALLARGLVTSEDLAWRKRRAEQRDLAKESEFLSHLFICPNCSHPSPQVFDRCPACGANPADFSRTRRQDPLGPTGNHFVAVETEEMVLSEDSEVVEDAEEIVETPDSQADQVAGKAPETDGSGVAPPETKASPRGSVRSFLSKFKKK